MALCGLLTGLGNLFFHRLKVNAQKLSSKSCSIHSVFNIIIVIVHSMLWTEFHQYLCQMCAPIRRCLEKLFVRIMHCQCLESQVPPVPTDLRSFLKHCKVQNGEIITIIILNSRICMMCYKIILLHVYIHWNLYTIINNDRLLRS